MKLHTTSKETEMLGRRSHSSTRLLLLLEQHLVFHFIVFYHLETIMQFC